MKQWETTIQNILQGINGKDVGSSITLSPPYLHLDTAPYFHKDSCFL